MRFGCLDDERSFYFLDNIWIFLYKFRERKGFFFFFITFSNIGVGRFNLEKIKIGDVFEKFEFFYDKFIFGIVLVDWREILEIL